jgi:hypothetical protein
MFQRSVCKQGFAEHWDQVGPEPGGIGNWKGARNGLQLTAPACQQHWRGAQVASQQGVILRPNIHSKRRTRRHMHAAEQSDFGWGSPLAELYRLRLLDT